MTSATDHSGLSGYTPALATSPPTAAPMRPPSTARTKRTRNKRTDVELMTAVLKGQDGARGAGHNVVARLVANGWEPERARSTVRRALEIGHPLAVGRFGNVMFCGTDSSIYDKVAYVLENYWGSAGASGTASRSTHIVP